MIRAALAAITVVLAGAPAPAGAAGAPTAVTAPTRTFDAKGLTIAYRCIGTGRMVVRV